MTEARRTRARTETAGTGSEVTPSAGDGDISGDGKGPRIGAGPTDPSTLMQELLPGSFACDTGTALRDVGATVEPPRTCGRPTSTAMAKTTS